MKNENPLALSTSRIPMLLESLLLLMVEKVTGEAVKKAVQKMKAGKSDISGSYTSDALLHSPDIIFDSLAEVFSSFLVHGTASRHLLVCAFLPLLKSNLKDPASTESYRAIAGN